MTRLTDQGGRATSPAWSPDGGRLAYALVAEERRNDRLLPLSLAGRLPAP